MKTGHVVLFTLLCIAPFHIAVAADADPITPPAMPAIPAAEAPVLPAMPPMPPMPADQAAAPSSGSPPVATMQMPAIPMGMPPMPPADQTPVDPKKLVVATEIVKGFDLKSQLHNAMMGMSLSLVPMLSMENPGQDEKIRKITDEAVEKAVDARLPELEKNKATVYAQLFSMSELEDLKKFYQSPTGKKLTEQTPEMMRRDSMMGQGMVMSSINDIRKNVLTQAKKADLKIPKNMEMQ